MLFFNFFYCKEDVGTLVDVIFCIEEHSRPDDPHWLGDTYDANAGLNTGNKDLV